MRYLIALLASLWLSLAPAAAQVTQPPAASGGGGGTSPAPAHISSSWFNLTTGAIGAGSAITTGRVIFLPVIVPKSVTITDLGINVTGTASGGVIAKAIYASNAATNRSTGNPLASCLITLTGSTGAYTCTLSSPVTLTPGLYFESVEADSTATTAVCIGTAATNLMGNIIGVANSSDLIRTLATSGGTVNVTRTYSATFLDATSQTYTAASNGASACSLAYKVQ